MGDPGKNAGSTELSRIIVKLPFFIIGNVAPE